MEQSKKCVCVCLSLSLSLFFIYIYIYIYIYIWERTDFQKSDKMIKLSGQTNTDNGFSNFKISFFIEKRTSSEIWIHCQCLFIHLSLLYIYIYVYVCMLQFQCFALLFCPLSRCCRIHWLHLCRLVRHPTTNRCPGYDLTVWWWGSINVGSLGNVEHLFIAIAPRSTLALLW